MRKLYIVAFLLAVFFFQQQTSAQQLRLGNQPYGIEKSAVWNVIGQKVMEEMVNGRNIIPLEIRTPGTYLVGSITFGGRVIETKKVIITGN